MKILRANAFKKDYQSLPDYLKKQTDRKLMFLVDNPLHPSLRVKKVKGSTGMWEARVTLGYRLIFQFNGNTIALLRVGPHDILEDL